MICSVCNKEKNATKNFEKWRTVCHSCKHKQRKKIDHQVSVTEKKCSKCKLILLAERFYTSKRHASGLMPDCKECHKQYVRKQYEKRGDKIRKRVNVYYHENKEELKPKRREYHKKKFKEDPKYRLIRRLRCRLKDALRKKSWKKNTHFSEYIGCTLDELKLHIENQFKDGMNWDNQGEWHLDHIIPLSSAQTEEELYKLCHYKNIQPLWGPDNLAKSNKIV